MRKMIAAAVVGLGLVVYGCSSSTTGGGSSLAGTWRGTATFTSSSPYGLNATNAQTTAIITQDGSNLGATVTVQVPTAYGTTADSATYSGSVSGSSLNLVRVASTSCPGGTTAIQGTVSGNTITFSVSGNDCASRAVSATGSLTRV